MENEPAVERIECVHDQRKRKDGTPQYNGDGVALNARTAMVRRHHDQRQRERRRLRTQSTRARTADGYNIVQNAISDNACSDIKAAGGPGPGGGQPSHVFEVRARRVTPANPALLTVALQLIQGRFLPTASWSRPQHGRARPPRNTRVSDGPLDLDCNAAAVFIVTAPHRWTAQQPLRLQPIHRSAARRFSLLTTIALRSFTANANGMRALIRTALRVAWNGARVSFAIWLALSGQELRRHPRRRPRFSGTGG